MNDSYEMKYSKQRSSGQQMGKFGRMARDDRNERTDDDFPGTNVNLIFNYKRKKKFF